MNPIRDLKLKCFGLWRKIVSGHRARILLVHAEGNIFNNPNLYDIGNILAERFDIDVLLPVRRINEGCSFSSKNIRLIEYLPIFGDFRFMRSKDALDALCAQCIRGKYNLVIGVDRDGLILAALLAGRLGTPYGMISYEIFFEDETSSSFKRPEAVASAGLSFVVAPDERRGQLLVRENRIRDDTEMLFIPVAPMRSHPYQKRNDLRELLAIPDNKKILIYVGSIASWTGIKDLLAKANSLPDDWVLVLHDRYGDTESKIRNLAVPALQENVYFTDIEIPTNDDMHKLLHSADMGLALYKPDYSTIWAGKNLAEVGLSSGKASVYLQHGLPVITTHNEILSPLIQSHGLGYSVAGADDVFAVLEQHESNNEQHRRCLEFFENYLGLGVYRDQLVSALEKSMHKGERQPAIVSEETILETVQDSLKDKSSAAEWTFKQFSECIEQLRNSGERFVVYGEDTLGLTIQALIPENVIAFVDYKSDRVATEIIVGEVYSPRNLPNMSYDRIIIGIVGQEAHAQKHLVHDLGLPAEKVVRCPSITCIEDESSPLQN